MIRPAGLGGAVFGTAAEGDARTDPSARRVFASAGVPESWAYLSQVHGSRVVAARRDGHHGEGDAMYVTRPGIAVTVATADCVPVVVEADGAVAVIHAGWRGAAAGVIGATLDRLDREGHTPRRAAVGPAICGRCYEVGAEVSDRFPQHVTRTRRGTTGVDLKGVVVADLAGVDVWTSDTCTMTDPEMFSYRRNRTQRRQVAVAWLPAS